MPAFSKLRIGALDDLARQLRFAPVETLKRQLERTRSLAAEIDPAITYPEDWIVFRITGYRPEIAQPAAFPGGALLADVSGLVERLSAAAKLSQDDLDPAKYLEIDPLCARWKVSRKTVERWRRMGLVALRVRGKQGKPRLLFPVESIERFERLQGGRLGEAAGYSRIGPTLEERMAHRAGVYARFGCTLNQAAKRIAGRYGRAQETVRQLLKRNDAGSARPLFSERGPPSARERELIARAYWLAIEPGDVAERLGRSIATVHRVADDERAARLRVLSGIIGVPSHGTGDAQAPDEHAPPKKRSDTRLSHEAVVSGLGETGATDLLGFVRGAREGGVALGVVERARAVAYRVLIARALTGIAALPTHGARATALDRIETDLRWAARLKAELVRSHLPLLVRTLEGALGRPLEEVRASMLAELVAHSIAALAEAVDGFEPGKGGRLAGPAGLALTRVGTRFVRDHPAESAPGRARAAAKLTEGIRIPDWTRRLSPWQVFNGKRWLEPDARVRAAAMAERERTIVQMRFGWGPAPATVQEIAAKLGITVMQAALLERSTVHRAGTQGLPG